MPINSKILLLILCFFLIKPSSSQELGVGVVAPTLGAQIMIWNEHSFIDLSVMLSNSALTWEDETHVGVKPFSLFYNRTTSAKTSKWLPFIGLGGMFIPYKYKNYLKNKEEGYILAIGISLGTYYKINNHFRTFFAANIGYQIIHEVVKHNPRAPIYFIPIVEKVGYVPKAGFIYIF